MHGFAAKLLRSLQTSLLMEQLNYNLMYRWFVGLSPDDPVWDPTTFTKNRDRLQPPFSVSSFHGSSSKDGL